MKLVPINYKTPVKFKEGLALCLGYFDGVHKGHVDLIKHGYMNRIFDGEDNLSLAVLTFDNPISKFKDTGKSKEVISTVSDRCSKISKLNIVDYLLVMHIDYNFAELSPEAFIEILKKMNVKQVFCGSDFRFGKDGKGDIDLLNKNFVLNVIDITDPFQEKISTHNIINFIKNGEIGRANAQLGYSYTITGKVSQGKKKGRDLGYPTINIKPSGNYVFPKYGVYKSRVLVGVREYLGMTNVGIRPTFGYDGEQPGIESHLIDVNVNDVYGEEVIVAFDEFIREERKFASIDDLKVQIAKDVNIIASKPMVNGPIPPIINSRALDLTDNLSRLYDDFGYDPKVVEKVMSESILTIRGYLGSQDVVKKVLSEDELNNLNSFINSLLKK